MDHGDDISGLDPLATRKVFAPVSRTELPELREGVDYHLIGAAFDPEVFIEKLLSETRRHAVLSAESLVADGIYGDAGRGKLREDSGEAAIEAMLARMGAQRRSGAVGEDGALARRGAAVDAVLRAATMPAGESCSGVDIRNSVLADNEFIVALPEPNDEGDD